MNKLRAGLGPLGRRLLFAFVLVAVSSVLVLTVAALIGVGYGWVAFGTRSVIPVIGPHAVIDASGVRAAMTIWLGQATWTTRRSAAQLGV